MGDGGFCGVVVTIGELFKRAIVRRVAYVVVALVLGYLGIGRAQAQGYPQCGANPVTCSQSEAAQAQQLQSNGMEACRSVYGNDPALTQANPTNMGHEPENTPPRYRVFWTCTFSWGGPINGAWREHYYTASQCPEGQIWNDEKLECQAPCTGRPDVTLTPTPGFQIPNGSVGCSGGCLYMSHSNGDGTLSGTFIGDSATCDLFPNPNECTDNGAGYFFNYGTSMCQPPPTEECAANEVKDPVTGQCNAGCPAGMTQDANGVCKPSNDTCPAGQVKGPDGSCVQGTCPAGQVKGADGTCKKDVDEDGEPDEDDESFSGGDDCSTPPACSGSFIMCGQARIQWRIDCNTRKNRNISGGSCAAIPVCTGEKCDALEYAQLLQQWRATCALEKIAEGSEGAEGEGDEETIGGGDNCQTAFTCANGGAIECGILRVQHEFRCLFKDKDEGLADLAADGDTDDETDDQEEKQGEKVFRR